MLEDVENGTSLGWLIAPDERREYVYSPGLSVECLEAPSRLPGDPLLPGLDIDTGILW